VSGSGHHFICVVTPERGWDAPVAVLAARIMGSLWAAEAPYEIERMLYLQRGSYFTTFFIIIRK